jgi:GDPmannose 4,6-dehydratase
LRGRQFLCQRVAFGLVEIWAGIRKYMEIGDLSARTDWGYAPDYTMAMQAILELDSPGEFIVATGIMHSVQDLVEAAAQCLALNWRDVIVETPKILQRDPLPLCGNSSRLQAMTGWRPSIGFNEMVRILVEAAQSTVRAS